MLEFLKIEGVTKNDLVITISSSGNSPNIISVLNYCKENNIKSLELAKNFFIIFNRFRQLYFIPIAVVAQQIQCRQQHAESHPDSKRKHIFQ